MLADMRHFAIGSFFNDDMIAAWNGQIDGGERRSNVERNPMVLGDNGNLIGANLVGRVSVGSNLRDEELLIDSKANIGIRSYPISAHNDCGNFSRSQKGRHHAVQHQSSGQFVVDEFVGRQTGSLVVWSCFRTVNVFCWGIYSHFK